MKTRESIPMSIATEFTAHELLEKLHQITAPEFYEALKDPRFKYYGRITGSEFELQSIKYGPGSNGPSLKGKICESENKVSVFVDADDEGKSKFAQLMTFASFCFPGIFIMIVGFFLKESRSITITAGAIVLASPFFSVSLINRLSRSMRKDELEEFIVILHSKPDEDFDPSLQKP